MDCYSSWGVNYCNFFLWNVMVTFLNRGSPKDIFGWQMWPPEGAAFEMRHSFYYESRSVQNTSVDQNLLFAKRFGHWLTLNPLALTNTPKIIHIIHLYNIFTSPVFSYTLSGYHGSDEMMSSLSPWRSTVVSYVFSCVFTTVLTDLPVFWCYGMGLVTW